ncbi:ABC transporter permease [Candidatus Poribacteria bacterium]|jgi:putative ABC transport system permease protein|nr:ABC transporter permease [Candidatus Poribacteria bacterium]MBT5534805.1 ABC transporter permease [Candidatus Poribacteria bacterium]MBT5714430.1 ABC transporter permease [Candidatus Poribacteria bacterium]MBT7101819.1 ABC transporter permease [Candidatus Poribacteria bacterium]MBT7807559.1 ABC transporter permease [Candidatus Poribacteria bacterium]
MIARMAFRNMFRQKRRSILTALSMGGGVALFAMALGMSDGSYDYIIDTLTRTHTGHVQIHAGDYLDRPSIYKVIDAPGEVGAIIDALQEARAWTPRVYAAALGFVDTKTSGVRVMGVDPTRETAATGLGDRVVAGRFLDAAASDEVLISPGLAAAVEADIGDELALITQAADGSIANMLYTIVGFLGDDSPLERNAYLHIDAAREFLALGDAAHEIAILLSGHGKAEAAALEIRAAVGDEALDVQPWQVVERLFYEAMQADKQGTWVSVIVIMIIVAVGVLNAVLMAILERSREYAVLRALGTQPWTVFRLIVLETLFIGIASIIGGTVVGLAGNWYLSRNGISLGDSAVEFGGVMFDRVLGAVTWQTIWAPAVVTLFTGLLASVAPALRAMRVQPAAGMRAH